MEHVVVESVTHPNAFKKWWSDAIGKHIRKLKNALRPRKASTPGASVAHEHGAVHHAGGHAAHGGLMHTGLHMVHIALPLLGTYLIAHMAHHDLHRAQHEWHSRRALVPTLLFYLGFLCDALDALAHAIIVLCLTLPESTYLNHHVEHQLHDASLYVALVACVAMMSGEAIVARHESHHAPSSAALAQRNLAARRIQLLLRASQKEKEKAKAGKLD